MFLSNPCEDDESLCNWVYDQTDSHEAGQPGGLADRTAAGDHRPGRARAGDPVRPAAAGGPAGLASRGRRTARPGSAGSRGAGDVAADQTHTQELRDLAAATRRVQRAKTMGDLLKSVITGVLVAIFGTMILSQLGVNIAPIIASAGILGIALGFGAQSLVKDFLSGRLHDLRGPVRRRRRRRRRRGHRHRRGGDACGSPGCATSTARSGTSPTARSCASATRARTGPARSSTSASGTTRTWPARSGCSARSRTTCGRTRTTAA